MVFHMKRKEKSVITSGKRKKAVASALITAGTGKIRINSVPLELVQPDYAKLRVKEALMLAGDSAKTIDIDVSVNGGGVWGQADAARTAIANALVQKDENLRNVYLAYDRSLLISDPRRTEPHKPSRSKDGPRASKQQSKR